MIEEAIRFLRPRPGAILLDATCGTAGHSLAILEECPDARGIGIERDPSMLKRALRRVRERNIPADKFVPVEGSYGNLRQILKDLGVSTVDGSLFDLGASALHLSGHEGRGFSLRASEDELDMRYSPETAETAAGLLGRLSAAELESIFRDLGGEHWARKIARAIVVTRCRSPIRTVGQFTDLVERTIPRRAWPPNTHPATRCYQALRIRVNAEFEEIRKGLPAAFEALAPGGRLAAISFHSGEDRLVKGFFRDWAGMGPGDPITGRRPEPKARILTKKPLEPGVDEVERNPGARSARMRALEKLG